MALNASKRGFITKEYSRKRGSASYIVREVLSVRYIYKYIKIILIPKTIGNRKRDCA